VLCQGPEIKQQQQPAVLQKILQQLQLHTLLLQTLPR
jgi:hypothetical protein